MTNPYDTPQLEDIITSEATILTIEEEVTNPLTTKMYQELGILIEKDITLQNVQLIVTFWKDRLGC